MYMTDEQKYNAVLKELGELLQSKNTTISCQKWQIDELKEKLAAAEAENAEAINVIKDLEQQLIDATTEIMKMEGGAA